MILRGERPKGRGRIIHTGRRPVPTGQCRGQCGQVPVQALTRVARGARVTTGDRHALSRILFLPQAEWRGVNLGLRCPTTLETWILVRPSEGAT